MIDDPYKVLGLKPDATEAEINAAYRAAARTAHPDGGGTVDEFDDIKQAHLILLDPEKRRKFDKHGIVDDNNPNNVSSVAMQRITMFLIQTVQATLSGVASQYLNFNQLDLIQGANAFFDLEIQNCHKRIHETDSQIKQFEKALKRLKTKRTKDVIRVMLDHHVSELKNGILAQRNEIAIYDEAKLIIKDYTFEQDDAGVSTQTLLRGFYR